MKKKIIIDCDPGVDDALTLILAFHSPELEVLAVTGVNGNVSLEKGFVNIQKILSLLQPGQIPFLARGASGPLRGESIHAHSVHGEDGLGGAKIDLQEGKEWWRLFPGPAEELFIQMAREHPHELTLVAIGPLTNLALGLWKNPEGMRRFKEVVIMGGAVRTKGNVTPYAEFNIYVDPLAARMVFESGLPITLVPLDVTHRVFLSPSVMEQRVKPRLNPCTQFLIEATGYNFAGQKFRGQAQLFHLHDPLALSAVIDPQLLKKEKIALSVETRPGERYGQTQEVAMGNDSKTPKLDVGLAVNSKKFLDLFLSRLGV